MKVEQPMAFADGRLFATTSDTIAAINADDGKDVWRVPGEALTAPVLVRSGWLIAATKGRLTALHAADGGKVWSRDMGSVTHRPTIDGELLFVPVEDGRLVALALQTGQTLWDEPVASSPTEPLGYGDRLYFGSDSKEFHCFKSARGEHDWSREVGARVIGEATADGEHVYFTAMNNIVYALDRVSGNQRWKKDLAFRPLSGPVLFGQHLALGGLATEVPGFDHKTGKPTGKLTLGEPVGAAPAFIPSLNGAPAIVVLTVSAKQEWKLSLAGPPAPKPAGDAKGAGS